MPVFRYQEDVSDLLGSELEALANSCFGDSGRSESFFLTVSFISWGFYTVARWMATYG